MFGGYSGTVSCHQRCGAPIIFLDRISHFSQGAAHRNIYREIFKSFHPYAKRVERTRHIYRCNAPLSLILEKDRNRQIQKGFGEPAIFIGAAHRHILIFDRLQNHRGIIFAQDLHQGDKKMYKARRSQK